MFDIDSRVDCYTPRGKWIWVITENRDDLMLEFVKFGFFDNLAYHRYKAAMTADPEVIAQE